MRDSTAWAKPIIGGEYEKAVDQFKRVLAIDEGFSYGYFDLGYVYADLGRIEEAFAQVKILEEKDPSLAATLSRYIYRVAPPNSDRIQRQRLRVYPGPRTRLAPWILLWQPRMPVCSYP